MPKFDAAAVTEPLEFDFAAFRPNPAEEGIDADERARREHLATLEWSGKIPEPSEDQVRNYFAVGADISAQRAEADEPVIASQRQDQLDRWRAAHPDEAGRTPGDLELNMWEDPTRIRQQLQQLAEVRAKSAHDTREQLGKAISELCSGHPQAAVLNELPYRVLQHFTGWLTGQFSPETLAAATKG